MGGVISGWKEFAFALTTMMVPICAYVMMKNPHWLSTATAVNDQLAQIPDAVIRKQMLVPTALSTVLPAGIKGLFCATMLCGFMGNFNTSLHSWSSIFIQDIIMPFRKKPLETKQHIFLLKLAIVGVAAFFLTFSLLYKQNEYILMFFSGSMSVYVAGAGAVIIGGLYWKRGTTAGAWTAMIVGPLLMLGWLLYRQVSKQMHEGDPLLYPSEIDIWGIIPDGLSTQKFSFFVQLLCTVSYTVVSLVTRQKDFNLDKMLHRGAYADDAALAKPQPKKGFWAKVGATREFTRLDKGILITSVIWSMGWFALAAIGTLYYGKYGIDDHAWSAFWMVKTWIGLVLGIIAVTWVSIGGIGDLRYMLNKLSSETIDVTDDGTVKSAEAKAIPAAPAAKVPADVVERK